jgi:LacI family transcriptional regulator
MIPIVANAEGDKTRQQFVIDQLVGRQIDGLILATMERKDPLLEHFLDEGIPVVVVNRTEVSGRVSCVVSDNHLAMDLALKHLVELGHRNIAHVAGPGTTSTGFERREGFLPRGEGALRLSSRRRPFRVLPAWWPAGICCHAIHRSPPSWRPTISWRWAVTTRSAQRGCAARQTFPWWDTMTCL